MKVKSKREVHNNIVEGRVGIMAGKIKFMTATKRKFDSNWNRYHYELWTARNDFKGNSHLFSMKISAAWTFVICNINLKIASLETQVWRDYSSGAWLNSAEKISKFTQSGSEDRLEMATSHQPWRRGSHLEVERKGGWKRKHDKLLLIFRSIFSRNVITFSMTMMEFSFFFSTSTIFLFKLSSVSSGKESTQLSSLFNIHSVEYNVAKKESSFSFDWLNICRIFLLYGEHGISFCEFQDTLARLTTTLSFSIKVNSRLEW